ncbi:MAG TPA: ABC-type transport auxiliary lipoprotein family protein [Sulfuricurvum sp.]|nr:ABC-type transport auxiliary lipoprotein family protein [Sulfuricurvum sp.]
MRHYPLYFVALILLGCSGKTPAINEYTLLSPQKIESQSTPRSSKSLTVTSGKAIGSLSTKNIIYLLENGETAPYLYSRWSDTPSALIQRALLTSLYEHALFSSLSPSSSSVQSDWVLESDLNAFYHRFSKDASDGYIDITYRLVDTRTKRPLATKRFTTTSPSPSMDAQGGVEALKKSTFELNRQCILWLSTLIKETK